ncbi:CPBP family glutamic-type intramembrane protease [Microbacterium sp. 179-B 1A2 NHS]|uniref:CPBP family glutamic-type intramembrane protease n=1 Tax=Microbacterium sp. 179-B 1A2 NHS TaxID=3142383 RepID=UPI0039A3EE44
MTAIPARAPRPLPDDATGAGLEFHRLVYARQRWGWWTPLVTGLLGLAFYLVLSLAVVMILVVVALADPAYAEKLIFTDLVRFDLTDPLLIAVLLGSIALLWPSYTLASLIVNGKGIGFLSSVAGRLRWRWMLLCAGVAVVVYVVLTAISMVLPGEEVAAGDVIEPSRNPAFLVALLVILLLVPFQAAAEEFVFRGYLQQAVGRWLRHPAWAILLPVPLFVLGHLYDVIGQTSVAVFAVAAGWLTWRTGGLEAAIALHVINNLAAFGLGVFGLSDVNATETSILSLVMSIVMIGIYAGLVELLWRRGDGRRRVRLTPPPAPVFAGYPAAAGYPGYGLPQVAPGYGHPGAPVYGQPVPPYGQAPVPPSGQAPVPPHGQAPVPPSGQPPVPPSGQAPVPPYGQPPVPPYGQPPVPGQPGAPAYGQPGFPTPPTEAPRQAPRWGEYAPGYPVPQQTPPQPGAAPAEPGAPAPQSAAVPAEPDRQPAHEPGTTPASESESTPAPEPEQESSPEPSRD